MPVLLQQPDKTKTPTIAIAQNPKNSKLLIFICFSPSHPCVLSAFQMHLAAKALFWMVIKEYCCFVTWKIL
ncbi:MAG: hypothetical protein A2W80_14325 [Candidatus Riflebacteria bacterium GWC2_50_8]|nr:MAG: hypothetical protein A2W80_14325 [Candidatus Riflebacteria bacterium GWC2_50_8]